MYDNILILFRVFVEHFFQSVLSSRKLLSEKQSLFGFVGRTPRTAVSDTVKSKEKES